MRRTPPTGRIVALGLLSAALGAQATTWRVERDGSGDFVVIQDAVNAAASGDTILLGPGRFDEHGPFQPGTVTIYDAYVGVDDIDLTFIGSGPGATIVGPATAPPQTQEIGFVLAAELAQTVRMRNLTLENLDKGLTAFGVRVLCEGVEFRDSESGAFLYQSVGSSISGSTFDNCRGALTGGMGSHQLVITDCDFANAYWHAINVGAAEACSIHDCTVVDSRVGFFFNQRTTATVSRSTISTVGNSGLLVRSGATVVLIEVAISSDTQAASVAGPSSISGVRNLFEGGSYSTLEFRGLATSTLQDSNIIKGSGPSVLADDYYTTTVDIDLRNNYWGTTDPDSIAAWIIDSNDNHNPPLDPNYGTVLFEPFRDRAIPTHNRSLGELKALFGPDRR